MIKLDYDKMGIWIAWRGEEPCPGKNILHYGCCPARMVVFLAKDEEIVPSEIALAVIGSSPLRTRALEILQAL